MATSIPTTHHRAARRSPWLPIVPLTILATFLAAQPLHAQDDWQHWGRDAGNQRHSPLTQIDVDNVSTLVPAWRYEMTKVGVPSRPSQSTPLMVDGVLYLSFPYYRVVALEPETGEEIWEYTAPGDWNSPEHQLHWTGGSMRGLAYWEGDDRTPPQIIFGTEEGELISLNAATGLPNPRFGSDGFVDLKTPDVMNGFPNMHYGISSGVAVWKHLVFTGVHNADETGSKGPAGDTRAWDLRTGELVWTFHTVPHPGEFGNDTWLDDSWRNVSGANTWSFFTIDAERGILYMPLGSAHNDFYGMDRPGDNLFSDSIVAVDALTGERLWHFQAVHHDLWDLDMPAPPILFDVERDGETIPAVGVMTKYPVLFIFNRVTGEPIYEIEERPVPRGNMPGEYYSPTQPFPVKPPPFGRIDFTMDDIATVTPEHTAACRELLMRFDGRAQPRPLHAALRGGRARVPVDRRRDGVHRRDLRSEPRLTTSSTTPTPATSASSSRWRTIPIAAVTWVLPSRARIYWHVVTRPSVNGWPLLAARPGRGWSRWTSTPARSPGRFPFGTVEGAPPGVNTGAPNSQKGGPTSNRGRRALHRRGQRRGGSAPTRRRPGASCGASRPSR